jgi:hypothetical protein
MIRRVRDHRDHLYLPGSCHAHRRDRLVHRDGHRGRPCHLARLLNRLAGSAVAAAVVVVLAAPLLCPRYYRGREGI